ncbi:MAG: CsbD family protein [Desulfovibrionaceae bacterium]|nr:CsbD family protein [Desulfovibrionaceae bacterium]MBF0515347.1 CsbD family protein [Desulfovibrionaceae bacterium]
MKSSDKNKTQGKLHQVTGKIKEVAGKMIGNPSLEIKGKVEGLDGVIQEKIGQLEKITEK